MMGISKIYMMLTVLVLILTVGCAPSKREERKFDAIVSEFIEQYLKNSPVTATFEGEHRYDGLIDDVGVEARQAKLEWLKQTKQKLAEVKYQQMGQAKQIDYQILNEKLNSFIFSAETLKTYETDPLVYSRLVGGAINSLITREFAPLEERMRNVLSRLKQIPRVLEQAKENLQNPPRIHTDTAIKQNKGLVYLITKTLPTFYDQVPDLKDSLLFESGKAVQAIQSYGKWLETELMPRSTGDFRLGEDLYVKKLKYTLQSDLTKEEILQRAQNDFERVHEDLFQTALPLYQQFFPEATVPEQPTRTQKDEIVKAVLDKLAEARPTDETIVNLAKDYLQKITDFVREQDLITLPPEPVQVIIMPEFRRGVAVAYCQSSGPLEKKKQTFFAVSPVPEDWTEERAKSFFKEYNNYMLQDLTVHEAMPGHYVQIAHSNKYESPIRSLFSSGTFVEGWAVYAEKMMVDAGYDGPEVKMQQLKMYLRVVINAILDQKIHTAGMSEEEAMKLMMEGGFQEEGEAAGKWRRACLTSTQLSTYFVGVQEMLDIRKQYEQMMGDKFNLKEFHDKLLAYGSPAPKYIRQILFEK